MQFIKHQPEAFVWSVFVNEKIKRKYEKNIKNEIKVSFQKYLEANLLNRMHNFNFIIIQNRVWYELTYRLFSRRFMQ